MFFDLNKLRERGAAPCLLHKDTQIGYDELADMADSFARRLPSERCLVAIEMEGNPTAISAYIGALAAGHAVMPLPAGEPELAQRMTERFRPGGSWRVMGGRRRLLIHDDPAALHPDLALLLQTSGSTGQGRGVRLSSAAVQANAVAIADYLRITTSDRAALILPLHYSYGLSVLHSHLASGASLWLAEGSVLDPGFPAALAASGANSLAGVPHHFNLLESVGLTDALPGDLRCLTVAGGAMKPAAVRRWAEIMEQRQGRFVVMYGQTEATARIAYMPPELAAAHPDAVGHAIPGGTLLLRDSAGHEIKATDTEGELIYRGPNVMMGYAGSAADLAREAELSELATGDLARRGTDGLFRITGRLSRMSKIAGLRIGHDVLERALADAGQEVAVWGDDEMIRIAVIGPPADIAERAARLAGVGAQHISAISCTEFPRHANGKINYPALERLEKRPDNRHSVISAFARSFAPRPVTPQDSFSGLGGDSLQHVELSLVLDRRLGGLPEHWEKLSIETLERASVRTGSAVPMPVLARALAILAVVVAHQTTLPVYGGAAAMVILLGMSVAEHRRPALAEWDILQFLKPVFRVLVPYALVLTGFALAWGQIPWASVFLIGNFGLTTPGTHLMLPYLYWFIEAYVQMTLLLLVLFRPQRMRLLLHDNPFAAGLALLGLAFVMRLVIPEFWPMDAGRSQFSVPWVFYLFALGWCIVCAAGPGQRLAVLAAGAIILPTAAYLGGNWYGGWIKYLGLLALTGLLIYVPRVPLPRSAVRGVMYLAQAAFPIYLLHRLVPEVLMPRLDLDLSSSAANAVAILGGIAIGLLAAAVQRRLGGALPLLRKALGGIQPVKPA